jgi:membrane protein YfhO
MIAILPSLVVIAAALLFISEKSRELTLMLLLVLVINELWTVSDRWNPVRPRREMYPSTPLIRKLQQLRTPEPFRIVGLGPAFFVNAPAMFGLEDIRAHDPMSNGRYLGLLRTLAKYDVTDYFAKWQDIETHLLDFLNVKYIVAPPKSDLNDPGRYRLVYDGKDGRIFQNMRVLPRFYPTPIVILEFKGEGYVRRLVQIKDWSDVGIVKTLPVENDRMRSDLLNPRPANSPVATLKLLQAKPTDFRMRVQAPRYSLIVSSQPFWPGWKVVANGREVEPLLADGAFIGFTVRPGTTDVRVYYDPWTFKLGVALAAATILIGIFYSIFRGRGYRLAPEVEQEFPVASPPVA